MSELHNLLWAHEYNQCVAQCRRSLEFDPGNIEAVLNLSNALRALGEYEEALRCFKLDGERRKSARLTPGNPGWDIEIACLYWLLGQRDEALDMVRGLVTGVLKRKIRYGDAGGGATQGLILYYMAITMGVEKDANYALAYLTKLTLKKFASGWPLPVAKYLLDTISFEDLLLSATKQNDLESAKVVAGTGILFRRQLCAVIFYDAVKYRASGDESRCVERMKECYALENPIIENEWYLARQEVLQA